MGVFCNTIGSDQCCEDSFFGAGMFNEKLLFLFKLFAVGFSDGKFFVAKFDFTEVNTIVCTIDN